MDIFVLNNNKKRLIAVEVSQWHTTADGLLALLHEQHGVDAGTHTLSHGGRTWSSASDGRTLLVDLDVAAGCVVECRLK